MRILRMLDSLKQECNTDATIIDDLADEFFTLQEDRQRLESLLAESFVEDIDFEPFDIGIDEPILEAMEVMEAKFGDRIERLLEWRRKTEKQRKRNLTRAQNLNEELKETSDKWKSLVAKKGHATRRYNKAIDALYQIYEKCDSERFKNIDNLKSEIIKVMENTIGICPECDYFIQDCICEK